MGENPASGFKGLRLHNTLTHTKDDFVPIDAANVRVYVCGPTVYDDAHIGNARPAIVFDVLYRLLRHLAKEGVWDGGKGETKVTYVRNITDIDDKIIDRARRDFPDMALNEAIAKVTAETEAQYHADIKALGCLEPDVEPRATEHIPEMVAMIRTLIDKDFAYAADGHVLFDVKGWKNTQGEAEYGKLSRRPLDEMIAGARVEVAPYKRDAMDFVLWKPSSAEEPGWDSPWGRGRPGWHLECSAMSEKHLGKTFDIHGGGVDLVFPHHENEIAQSRCAHGTEIMANYWLHNGFLQVEGEKMAKSEGNFVTIRELLREWPGPTIRLAMLTTRYHEPLDWTRRLIEQADLELANWTGEPEFAVQAHAIAVERLQGTFTDHLPEAFLSALTDDLNTPQALTVLRQFAAKTDRTEQEERHLFLMAEFLGLVRHDHLGIHTRPIYGGAFGLHDIQATLKIRAAEANGLVKEKITLLRQLAAMGVRVTISDDGWISADATETERTKKVQSLVDARNTARAEKKFAEADRIRDELDAMGIQLMDAKDPDTGERVTTWEVKR